ncbi:MAG TPA: thioesterase family protein [Solirubrobacterales bacterium]|nr:thioesterase family protein [Solirubrobacterales bacterium]
MTAPAAFYERDGDRYLATELTRGPWDPGAQHAGPPAALLGREIERLPEAAEFQVGRVTCEILRSVPIAPITVSARVLRPGRRVQLVEAELRDQAGEPLMRATAWRIRTAAVEIPAEAMAAKEPPPRPEQGAEAEFFPTGEELGYHSAMEVLFVNGGFVEPGPALVWLRMRQPLVAGEEPTPLQRVLVTADVGNGASASLDYRRYLFINVDLTVHLERMPVGEWVCVDAQTLPQPNGVGTAESVLSDQDGRIGRALQTLLIAQR